MVTPEVVLWLLPLFARILIFYSAAVASAGNHDNNMYNKGWVEIHYGVRESKKNGERFSRQ